MLIEMLTSSLRSGTPLIYRAVPSWFIRVQPIVDQLVTNNLRTLWSAHLLLPREHLLKFIHQGASEC